MPAYRSGVTSEEIPLRCSTLDPPKHESNNRDTPRDGTRPHPNVADFISIQLRRRRPWPRPDARAGTPGRKATATARSRTLVRRLGVGHLGDCYCTTRGEGLEQDVIAKVEGIYFWRDENFGSDPASKKVPPLSYAKRKTPPGRWLSVLHRLNSPAGVPASSCEERLTFIPGRKWRAGSSRLRR